MDLIVLNDGVYHLVPVTKELLESIRLYSLNQMDFFDLCEILRIKLSTHAPDPVNAHVMNNGSGYFFGCIWK